MAQFLLSSSHSDVLLNCTLIVYRSLASSFKNVLALLFNGVKTLWLGLGKDNDGFTNIVPWSFMEFGQIWGSLLDMTLYFVW